MRQYDGLLQTIEHEYHILRGKEEDERFWKARIVYSFLAQTGYSSLYDIREDGAAVSIIHFKSRVTEALNSIVAMYPELHEILLPPENAENTIADKMYNIFRDTGCLYHQPYRAVPCVRRIEFGKEYAFLRGCAVDDKKWVSGIGCYLPLHTVSKPKENSLTFGELFQLQKNTLAQNWSDITEGAQFNPQIAPINLEYLRTKPPYTKGYWMSRPDNSGEISLARTINEGGHFYYAYKICNSTLLFTPQLPNWMTDGLNWVSVAAACLASKGTLPYTTFKINGSIVEVKIGYLFPPAELNFIKLYSWPTDYKADNDAFTTKIMSLAVFNELKTYLENIGYKFKEEEEEV